MRCVTAGMRLALAVLAASLVACSVPADGANDPLGRSRSAIVGGAAETGDPAVVVFDVTGPSGGQCTAEFIATTVLLTAAHCVLDEQRKPLTGAQYRIYRGNDYDQATASDWITIDPSNVHPNPAYDGTGNDIAVLVLSTPVNVTPLAWSTTAVTNADVGKSVRLVGYGSNNPSSSTNDGFGIKRQLTTTIDDVNAQYVHIGHTGANGCDGDSGGPALLTVGGVETIIALDSYSDGATNCAGGDYYQRVDTQVAFIQKYLPAPPGGGASSSGGTTSSGGDGTPSSSDPSSSDPSSSDDGASPTPTTHHATAAASSGCDLGGAPLPPDRRGAAWTGIFLAVVIAASRRRG